MPILEVEYNDVDLSYTIKFGGRPIFQQPGNPEGGSWTQAEMHQHAGMIRDNYFNALVIEPVKEEVREIYNRILSEPYVRASDNSRWDGSFESLQKMHAALQLVELHNTLNNVSNDVTLFDLDNNQHVMTVQEAEIFLLELGNHLAGLLARKQVIYRMLKGNPTEEELNKISTGIETFLTTNSWPVVDNTTAPNTTNTNPATSTGSGTV